MKTLALLLWALWAPVLACDACRLSLGLFPNDRLNRVSVGWRYSAYAGYVNLPQGGHQPHPMFGKTQHGPGGHGSTDGAAESFADTDRERFTWLSVRGQLWVSPRWAVFFSLPVQLQSERTKNDRSSHTSLADASLMLQWVPLWKATARQAHRLVLGLGAELPTGPVVQSPGSENPYALGGSGSVDPLVTLAYMLRRSRWGLLAEANARLGTTGSNSYRQGHGLGVGLRGFGVLNLDANKRWQLMPGAGVYAEAAGSDVWKDETVSASGGWMLGPSLGLDLFGPRWNLSLEWVWPLHHQLNGTQLANSGRLQAQAGWAFAWKKPQPEAAPKP